MELVEPTIPDGVTRISDVREACAEIIKAATDDVARVHASWKLKASFEKGISLFKRASDKKIHGWMVGTSSILPTLGQNGAYEFIGGRKVNRVIRVTMWGFYDVVLYDEENERASLDFIENECELIGDWFASNPKLGLEGATWLGTISPFIVENLDVHSPAEGIDVHLAQCYVDVTLRRY